MSDCTLTDSCPCGATLAMESGFISNMQDRHDKWLADHAVCRERWSTPSSFVTFTQPTGRRKR